MAFASAQMQAVTTVNAACNSGVSNPRNSVARALGLNGRRFATNFTSSMFRTFQSFRREIPEGKAVTSLVVRAGPESATPTKPKQRYPGEAKGFVEEMRFVSMKLHTKSQAKEGEKEDVQLPVAQWKPSIQGYLLFLVSSKKVYDTLEEIVSTSSHPCYGEFKNTGLERAAALQKDLEWFKSEGYEIPEASEGGNTYADYLKVLSENDPPAFICHFYNVYFAHSAGGRFIGQKVADMILNGRILEFYKWDGDLQELLTNVKKILNQVAEGWTREEKNHCLEETALSFKYSGSLLRHIASL